VRAEVAGGKRRRCAAPGNFRLRGAQKKEKLLSARRPPGVINPFAGRFRANSIALYVINLPQISCRIKIVVFGCLDGLNRMSSPISPSGVILQNYEASYCHHSR
jgi:hypothetical protein